MFATHTDSRDARPAIPTSARDERFNRRLQDSALLKHLCGFDIDLFDAFDAMQAVSHHA